MKDQRISADLSELLRHSGWIKHLAFATLRDHGLAEDVTQEVLVKALQQPRRKGRILRAWLKVVTVNTARSQIQSAQRRSRRDMAYARRFEDYVDPNSSDEIQDFVALAKAVDNLSAKSRQIIVLRFFHELPFADIAARLQINVPAAQVRCHRALAELRNSLTAARGDWSGACLAVLPTGMALPKFASAPLGIGLLVESRLLQTLSFLLLVAMASFFWVAEPTRDEAGSKAEFALAKQLETRTTESLQAELAEADLRRTSRQSSQASATEFSFHGTVYFEGEPVADAKVTMWQADRLLTGKTNAQGQFEFEGDASTYAGFTVTANGMGRSISYFPDQPQPLRVDLLATDPEGEPVFVYHQDPPQGIPGARVEVYLNQTAQLGSTYLPEAALEFVIEGETGEDGSFRAPGWLSDMPLVLKASAPGFHPAISTPGYRSVRLVQEGPTNIQLVDGDGKPFANRAVLLGRLMGPWQSTDENGYLPSVPDWGLAYQAQTRHSLPRELLLDLGNGNYLHKYCSDFLEEEIQVNGDRIRLVMNPATVLAQLGEITVPSGHWVEARIKSYASGFHATGFQEKWMRVGKEAVVLSGSKGRHGHDIEARLMPGHIPLGEFYASDGLVVIESQLEKVKFQLIAPKDVKSIRHLVEGKPSSFRKDKVLIPIRDGWGQAYLPAGHWRFRLREATAQEWAFIGWEKDEISRPSHSLTTSIDAENSVVVLKRWQASKRQVQMSIDGVHPVSGVVDGKNIDAGGWVEIYFDESDLPLISHFRVAVPVTMNRASGGPILSHWYSSDLCPPPGKFWQDSASVWHWDLQLAKVELQAPEDGFDGGEPLRVSVGGIYPDLQWPIAEKVQTLAVNHAGDSLQFRVFEGKYAFVIGEKYQFGGEDGVTVEGGILTSLSATALAFPSSPSTNSGNDENSATSTPASPR